MCSSSTTPATASDDCGFASSGATDTTGIRLVDRFLSFIFELEESRGDGPAVEEHAGTAEEVAAAPPPVACSLASFYVFDFLWAVTIDLLWARPSTGASKLVEDIGALCVVYIKIRSLAFR